MPIDRKSVLKPLAAIAVVSLMALSYAAGTAQAGPADTIAKLDHSVDFLVKAKAILGSTSTRAGYANIEKAKAEIDAALGEIAKAKAANGG